MAQSKQVRTVYQTPAFRISYPALFEAKETLNGDFKFQATMLFPKLELATRLKAEGHPAANWIAADNGKGFYAEILKVARGNFGPEVALDTLKLTKFRDGDLPKPNGKIEENDKGHIIVRTSTKDRPKCLRQDKTIITDPGELYAGCWVRAILTVAPFLKPQHGVTVYLAGIQKLAEDAAFSSRPRVEDEFDAVATTETFDGGDIGEAEAAQNGNPWE